jgi:hypothetical protein
MQRRSNEATQQRSNNTQWIKGSEHRSWEHGLPADTRKYPITMRNRKIMRIFRQRQTGKSDVEASKVRIGT